MSGLNLVKGGFPAKEGRSKAQIGRTSARCAGRNAPHGAPGRRKVRRKSVPRRCKRTGGVHPSAQAVPSGQHAWSHGKHEFWVCVPAPLGSSPSVYLAEFLRFARLRRASAPTAGPAAAGTAGGHGAVHRPEGRPTPRAARS
jgi:hypothetical protein